MADTLKIFQPELRKKSIEFSYNIMPEYDTCNVNWVMADLVRVSQVMVNLMTNAIKFTTKSERKKKINIEVAASIERPSSYPPNVVFFKTDDVAIKTDATGNPEWGDGEPLYIMVAVKDTGIGISEENQAKLFERFQQATPKTGQMYGGSGLGLNIARKMCQLHGGEIGVSSVEGEGSCFGFFFRVRRGGEPEDADKLEPKELSDKLKKSGHVESTEVDEDKVSSDLKNISKENTGKDSNNPAKDRWQSTADNADQMSKQNNDSKSAGDQDGKPHSRAQDDESQRQQKRPANAGRSSQRPDPTLEKQQSGHSENNDKRAMDNPEDEKKSAKKYEDVTKGYKQISNPHSDSKPTILFVEVCKSAPLLYQLLTWFSG
jgi:two-component sensor histidine kinase